VSSPIAILTHGDLDGMVCGILLLRAVSQDASIRITNGEKLANELGALADLPEPPQDVFITDIPLVSHAQASVLAIVAALKKRGSRTHVYDHHHGWEAAQPRSSFATFIVDVRKTTAAAIVWRELLRGDKPSQRWLQLLSEKDQSKDVEIVRDFGLLAALMQPMHWGHTDAALRALASGAELSANEASLSRWYFEIHVPREREIASNAEILTSTHGRKLAWIDLRAYREHFNVSRHAVEMHGVDVVATVIQGAVLLGGQSIDHGIDLTFLHGKHALGTGTITVAGHKSPVRISPQDGKATDPFVAAVRQFILDRL